MPLGLKDGVTFDKAGLADRTINRAQHSIGFTGKGAHFRFQCTGEETVEVLIRGDVFFYRFSHVDIEVSNEPATHQVF